jgi:serine O-acetyltransferase
MQFKEYRYLVLSDLYRCTGTVRFTSLLRQVLLGEGYKYVFWMRTCRYTRENALLKILVHPVARLWLRRYRHKFGISIPFYTEIGSGFFIGHFGDIVVNGNSRIGKNCNMSQGVTLGQANRGSHQGYPTLGDNVYIGPGAKIIGAVKVGNNVAIGANCVVTHDVPDHGVVVGVPGKVISYDGSEGYINETDYASHIDASSAAPHPK